jgi:hypothetical protein
MQSNTHYVLNHLVENDPVLLDQLSDFIISKQINKLFLYTPGKILSWLNSTNPVNHPVEITTLYFCTPEIVKLAQEKKVKMIKSVFGDTTIAYGFLVKSVDLEKSIDHYEPNCIGSKLDNFFDFKIENGYLYICSPGLGITEWKTSRDNFEFKNNKYYFLGRGTDYRINDEWINHNEIESKVNELFTVNQEEGATIVVDNEEQQVYLAVWINNAQAEIALDRWLSQRYQTVSITKRAHNLDKNNFMGARKISRLLLKEYFRSNVTRSYTFTNPWTLS